MVWEDNRVPSSSTHKIISPRDSFPLNSRVSYLIDAEQKCWNLNLLNRFFLPFEAEEIASIPLSIRLLCQMINRCGQQLQMDCFQFEAPINWL